MSTSSRAVTPGPMPICGCVRAMPVLYIVAIDVRCSVAVERLRSLPRMQTVIFSAPKVWRPLTLSWKRGLRLKSASDMLLVHRVEQFRRFDSRPSDKEVDRYGVQETLLTLGCRARTRSYGFSFYCYPPRPIYRQLIVHAGTTSWISVSFILTGIRYLDANVQTRCYRERDFNSVRDVISVYIGSDRR